jgi:hypothetical protein
MLDYQLASVRPAQFLARIILYETYLSDKHHAPFAARDQ